MNSLFIYELTLQPEGQLPSRHGKTEETKINTSIQHNKGNYHLNNNFYSGRCHKIISSLKRKENYVYNAIKYGNILQREEYNVYNKI